MEILLPASNLMKRTIKNMAAAANDNNTKWTEETTTFLELVNKQKCQTGWKQELNSTMHLELIPSQRPLLLRWYNDT